MIPGLFIFLFNKTVTNGEKIRLCNVYMTMLPERVTNQPFSEIRLLCPRFKVVTITMTKSGIHIVGHVGSYLPPSPSGSKATGLWEINCDAILDKKRLIV